MEKIRAAIIGTGRISDLHAAEYLRNPRAELVAVCDTDEVVARQQAARWGVARVYTDYRALLDAGDIDLVEVLLPHHLHAPVAIAALSAGIHVSVQKPMALDLTQADAMITTAAASGRTLRIFENALFYPPVQRARQLIDDGAIGTPLSIRLKANKADPRLAWNIPVATRAWRQDLAQSGGGPLTFDDGHHKFALARHFMGPFRRVHAWIGRTELEPGVAIDSQALINWEFDGGRLGSLEVVYSPELQVITAHYAQHDPIEITGSRGVLWVTRGHAAIANLPPLALFADRQLTTFDDVASGWETSFAAATRQHIDALLDGGALSLDGAAAREVLRACLAAQESARLGCTVEL